MRVRPTSRRATRRAAWAGIRTAASRRSPSCSTASLRRDGGLVRVIAGGFGSAKGPARTFTPVNLLDVNLRAGHSVRLNLRDGFSGALYVLKGRIVVNNERASETELVVLDREG